jgi:acyl-CoA synthetase (AMP-forming)/AMP-acid ligase II
MTMHRTIADALIEQAGTRSGSPAFTVLDDDGKPSPLTYDELLERSLGVANRLRERGLRRGERVLICLPTSAELLAVLWGVVLAGGVCVPVYPPAAAHGLTRWKEQVAAMARVTQPCGAVVSAEARLHMAAVLEAHGEDRFTVTPAELPAEGAGEPETIAPDDLAFIQFTSGTTRQPRGVSITHGALMANVRALVAGLGLQPADVSVSWLPPYHDMGLVGHVFTPVERGAHQVLMPPGRFLLRPVRWLRLISDLGATQTTAPNSAYSMCIRRVPRQARADLHLGTLRWALNGAELVQVETQESFCEAFSPCGFEPQALRPVYGLAEATLAVSLGPVGGPRYDWVNRRLLAAASEAVPAPPGSAEAQAFACVGAALPAHELQVMRSEDQPCAEREIGEIWFRGPSVMKGYFNDPQATREVLRDGWLRTGDLGYLADGQLYVTGRRKELIIKGGRNYLPADVEAVCMAEPQLRAGRAVAFGLTNRQTGTEDLVLVAEVRERGDASDRALAHRLTTAVVERTGVRPDRVELVVPGLLPKTTSGKLQRGLVRAAYASGGSLERPGRWQLEALTARGRSWLDLAWLKMRRRLGWQ